MTKDKEGYWIKRSDIITCEIMWTRWYKMIFNKYKRYEIIWEIINKLLDSNMFGITQIQFSARVTFGYWQWHYGENRKRN